MNMGEKLLELRKKARLSQEEAAEKLGVARQTVSKWETGQSIPDLEKTKEICGLYHIQYDFLIGPQPGFMGEPTSMETIAEEIDWTAAWSKKYPILMSYQAMEEIQPYREEISRLYDRFLEEFGMGHQDTVLVLKDILYQKYKTVKKH